MALLEPVAYKIARELMTCFCAELAANALEDNTLEMPDRCCLRAGSEIPLDVTPDGFTVMDLCCLGEAYVKVNAMYPATGVDWTSPDTVPLANGCQLQRLTVGLEMGTIRCIDDAKGCTENELKLRWMLNDGMAAYRAACCWSKAIQNPVVSGRGTKWFAGVWEQGGPDGDCLTGNMQLFANFQGPGCC